LKEVRIKPHAFLTNDCVGQGKKRAVLAA